MRYFKVYGISDCPSCLYACAALMQKYPETECVFINGDFSKGFRERTKKRYDFSTFPIIVLVEDEVETLIGGHVELLAHFSDKNVSYEAPPVRNLT